MNTHASRLVLLLLSTAALGSVACSGSSEDATDAYEQNVGSTTTFEAHERIDLSPAGFTRTIVDAKTGMIRGAHPEKFVTKGSRVFLTKSFATGEPESTSCGALSFSSSGVSFTGSCGLADSYATKTTAAGVSYEAHERIDLVPGGFTRETIDPRTGLMVGAHPEKYVTKGTKIFLTKSYATGEPQATSCGSISVGADYVSFAGTCGLSSSYDKPAGVAVAASAILPGKYVSNGKMLMIYGTCSDENFLGDLASGELGADGHTMRVPEGNVCGGYKLLNTSNGVVQVTWQKPEGSHLGAAVEADCRSIEGSFAMTIAGQYRDITPGTYKHGATSLVVQAGCGLPSQLGGLKSVIKPKVVSGTAKPYFSVPEGNVCGGYVLQQTSSGVQITWQKPEGAHLGAAVEANCASASGLFTRK